MNAIHPGRAKGEQLTWIELEMTERFERLARLTRRLFDAPIVVVDLDANEPELTSASAEGSARDAADMSLHAWVRRQPEAVVVADILTASGLAGVRAGLSAAGIRAFAGHPIHHADGRRCGSVLVAFFVERTFDATERELLEDLARSVELQLQATALATVDELTGLTNRRGFDRQGMNLFQLCRRHAQPLNLLYFDLNGFKDINDRHGHAEGDRALTAFAGVLTRSFRASDLICRMGGDEFVILAPGADAAAVDLMIDRARAAAVQLHQDGGTRECVKFSVGCVPFDAQAHPDLRSLLRQADDAMYERKRQSALRTEPRCNPAEPSHKA